MQTSIFFNFFSINILVYIIYTDLQLWFGIEEKGRNKLKLKRKPGGDKKKVLHRWQTLIFNRVIDKREASSERSRVYIQTEGSGTTRVAAGNSRSEMWVTNHGSR